MALGHPARYAQTGQAKDDIEKAGDNIKEAGKETGKVAKNAGKSAKKSAKAVKNEATAKTYQATCKDGTTFKGKTRSGACKGHGGVKVWTKG